MATDKGAIEAISLDASLDDIADLPGFVSFPTGAYNVVLVKGFVSKSVNKHPAIEMAMTMKEILDLPEENLDEGEEPPKPEDVATQVFMLDNEYGAGNFKKIAKPISAELGTKTIRELLEQSVGLELTIAVKRRKGKKGTEQEDKNFMDITNVIVT